MMRWLVDVEVDMPAGSLSDEDLELLRGELYRGVTKDILGPRPSFVVERVARGLHIAFPMTAGDEGEAWAYALRWIQHVVFAHPERRGSVSRIETRLTPEG